MTQNPIASSQAADAQSASTTGPAAAPSAAVPDAPAVPAGPADAAAQESPVRYRRDYTPPAYWIDTVDLTFDLAPERTVCRNRMTLHRHADALPGSAAGTLELVGEHLTLLSAHVDGVKTSPRITAAGIVFDDLPERCELVLETACHPAANTSLSGLYVSNGNFFTQCEAEGFRRITYFLDRPDVMSVYTVTLRADATSYPVLLSNGNLVAQGALDDGRHFARWEDPFKKPAYLFALVGGKLERIEETITDREGNAKLLQVWVEAHDLDKTRHALDALIHSIRWDERRFGLGLDLDRFMIVAVSDFNMGAMENKGLNIFNTKFVLARPETASDADYANIEAVVGHEYFHNWTGNRVTCRDWFQLSLKEGLTVFRDQEFSADMAAGFDASARDGKDALKAPDLDPAAPDVASAFATKRIEDVRLLRQTQFSEDAGPMAHPVRPESYAEINNFYTVTIYEKGAEVVRMYQTLLGRDGFRRGMDLYFARHDGQAVTCDDFRAAMADANQRDLSQFERWYSQAGTPVVAVTARYDANARTYTLTLAQSYPDNPAIGTPKEPLLIPFALGLVDPQGHDMPLRLAGEALASGSHRVFELTERETVLRFEDVAAPPIPSLLRNFSAPVNVTYAYADTDLMFLLAHDSDPFNRWEAAQRLATRSLVAAARAARGDAATATTATTASTKANATPQSSPEHFDPRLIDSFGAVLRDESLAPAFRELVLTLPSEAYLIEQLDQADPQAVHLARTNLRRALAVALQDDWLRLYEAHKVDGPYRPTPQDAGHRALKNLALSYLAELPDATHALRLASAQYDAANNMTDRFAALSVLLRVANHRSGSGMGAGKEGGPDFAGHALDDFYRRFEKEPLVIDKWFALQAMQSRSDASPTLDVVRTLLAHPAFTLRNPNRARSLIFSFCAGNLAEFHRPNGEGYAFWADQVIALDALNPQVAARLARTLERWRKFVPGLQARMRPALERVAAAVQSKDVREVIEKALAN